MPDYKNNPPSWQPNATKSAQGWRHPETNELLVAIRLDIEEEVKPAKEKDVVKSNAKAPKKQIISEKRDNELVAQVTQEPVEGAVVDFKLGKEQANTPVMSSAVLENTTPDVKEEVIPPILKSKK
jgi:D-alanyl-D-alanine carboxypeptidase